MLYSAKLMCKFGFTDGVEDTPRSRWSNGILSYYNCIALLFCSSQLQRPTCNRFNQQPECAFDSSRLNFAIHIRLGDRRYLEKTSTEYFALLDGFMDTVTAEVMQLGGKPPLFHVFSETMVPCPNMETGFFEEFSSWAPVEKEQVRNSQLVRVCIPQGLASKNLWPTCSHNLGFEAKGEQP